MTDRLQGSFFRLTTDREVLPAGLDGSLGSPTVSTGLILGGGLSLAELPVARVLQLPLPRLAVNLAGTHLVRPTHWTSYDPTVRFHRSLYLDAGVQKFVHRRRAMDVIPGGTEKVCECPNLFCFDRCAEWGFGNWLPRGPGPIVDWRDSLVQALAIAHRLGLRRLLLAGCEMFVAPSPAQREAAADVGVTYVAGMRLGAFVRACHARGLSAAALDALPTAAQYHFGERKRLADAIRTDEHYDRVTQFLRLSRRTLCEAGLELISVTATSRLNDFFPYATYDDALADVARRCGDPACEPAIGVYARSGAEVALPAMCDVPSPARDAQRESRCGLPREQPAERDEREMAIDVVTPCEMTAPLRARDGGADAPGVSLAQRLRLLRKATVEHAGD